MNEPRNIKTCFVSAPQETPLDALRESLAMHHIRLLAPLELATGTDLATEVQRALEKADLVIGVLPTAELSSWVLFELGQAWALGKRMLVIAPPGSRVPAPLQRLLLLQTAPDNREAIDFALDQLTSAPLQQPAQDVRKPSESTALGDQVDGFLARLEESAAAGQWRELEKVIADAIRTSGVDVMVESPGGDQRFDIAVWSDVLEPFVGNPLLIEVKSTLPSRTELMVVLQRLFASSSSPQGQWAMLVYGKGPPEEALPWDEGPHNVLVVSARTLIEGLRTQSFPEIVRDLRNRRVHGVEP